MNVCVDVMNDMIMFTNILLFFILSHFAALCVHHAVQL